jgi:hypothetical protein
MIFTTRVVQIALYTSVFFSDFYESPNLNFFQKKKKIHAPWCSSTMLTLSYLAAYIRYGQAVTKKGQPDWLTGGPHGSKSTALEERSCENPNFS